MLSRDGMELSKFIAGNGWAYEEDELKTLSTDSKSTHPYHSGPPMEVQYRQNIFYAVAVGLTGGEGRTVASKNIIIEISYKIWFPVQNA